MKRIEAIADVGPDRQVTLQLPSDLAEGSHRLTVLIDEVEPSDAGECASSAEDCLIERQGILVYTGRLIDDPDRVLEELRLERERRFLDGSTDESPL